MIITAQNHDKKGLVWSWSYGSWFYNH